MDELSKNRLLRSLPSVDEVLSRASLAPLFAAHPRPRAVEAARRAVEAARARLLAGGARAFEDADVEDALGKLARPNLVRVLNATGVVLHTNLGRAPLAPAAADRVREIAASYSNLEYDLEEGERGSRYAPVVGLLQGLTGAEDGLVVNNNAAAVLLALAALAQGKEAIVSRGELVEIGGGFRVPDVMRQSGARLREVGTTNRTRVADYAEAIGPDTALLMKVHKSNFAQVGFTEEATLKELAELARARGLPLFEDLGSGCLVPLEAEGLTSEPTVRASLAAGADLCAFSGDKLLGGPQAGILVGRASLIDRIKKHPLNRAVRVDKMTVAALEATLELYRDERLEEIPALALLRQGAAELEARAGRLAALLQAAGVAARVVRTTSQVGGGAMPLAAPVSFACAVGGAPARRLQDRLRDGDPPVIARISDEQLLLDARCLLDGDLDAVAGAVKRALG